MAIFEQQSGSPGDLRESLAAEEILAIQNEILRMVATGAPLHSVLHRLTCFIEEKSHRALCSILLFDDVESRFRFGSGPSLPIAYNRAIDGAPARATIGSCGAAVHRREMVIVEDIAIDPLWTEIKEVAHAAGLAACTSAPIFDSKRRVIGTYAFYYRTPTAPDARDLELIEISRDLAGVAIERARQEEELLRLNGDLERRVRERTEELEAFTFSVSHDLRAPLRAIEGRLELVTEEFGPALKSGTREHVEVARRNVRHMSRLIDDLLEFSHTSQKPLRKTWVEPSELIPAAFETLGAEMEGREIEVRTAPLPACYADRGLLKQVFVNLLSNALKYSRGRSPARIEVGGRNSGNQVEYSVSDNGIGFDMRHKDQIFGVFQRLHATESFEGTGIGLALVARIVQRHGGIVWAEATPGKGARFFFSIPAGRPE